MSNAKVLVIMGASGYLAKSKIFPTLWDLYQAFSLLPQIFHVVAYSPSKLTIRDIKERSAGFMSGIGTKKGKADAERFWKHVKYICGEYTKTDQSQGLTLALQELEQRYGNTDRLFYMTVPSDVQQELAFTIKSNWMAPNGSTRIAFELPIATDSISFKALEDSLSSLFQPRQICRVDSHLSDDLVTSLFCLRFGNELFPGLWGRDCISSVMLTYKERDFGTLNEGVLISMLNIMSLIGMEKPNSADTKDIQESKLDFLQAVDTVDLSNVVVAKVKSNAGTQNKAPDEHTEKSIMRNSKINFVTFVLYVRNERWEEIPFILRYGYSVDETRYDVRIQLKAQDDGPNEVVYQLKPCEKMILRLNLIEPSYNGSSLNKTELDLSYGSRYGRHHEAHTFGRVILSLLDNERQPRHFMSRAGAEKAWEIIRPLQSTISSIPPKFYENGTSGPQEADNLCNKHNFLFSACPS